MADTKLFGGENDLIKTRLHSLTQDAYIVTEEKVNSFNNYSFEFQIAISLFSIFFGAVIGSYPTYSTNEISKTIFIVCSILAIVFFLIMYRCRNKFSETKNGLFVKLENTGNSSNELDIISAIYGTIEKNIDVTERLKSKIHKNQLLTFASNDIGGDPIKGEKKYLIVNYAFRNQHFEKKFEEGIEVKLP